MKRLLGVFTLLAFALVLSANSQKAAAPKLTIAEAIETVRALNTAELEVYLKSGSYCSLGLAIRNLKEPVGSIAVRSIETTPESSWLNLKGYRLSLLIAADSKHYQLALTPAEASGDCADGIFSDESGTIYSGAALGCK